MADDAKSSNKPSPPRPAKSRSVAPPASAKPPTVTPPAPPVEPKSSPNNAVPVTKPPPPPRRSAAPEVSPPVARSLRPSARSNPSGPPIPPVRAASLRPPSRPPGAAAPPEGVAIQDDDIEAVTEQPSQPRSVRPPRPPRPPQPSLSPLSMPPGAIEISPPIQVKDRTTDITTLRVSGPTPIVEPPTQVPAEPRARATEDLLQALRSELAQQPKGLRAGRLHYEVARLLESPIADFKAAADSYLRAHALLSEHLPSIRGARRTLIAIGRAQDAVPLFDVEIKLTAEPEHKAQLLYDKACLLEDVLGQRKEAREALEQSAELGKGDPTRIKGTERAEALARAWDGLARALEREANAIQSDGKHRAALIAARARLFETHRNDAATAVELYQRALESDPQTMSALHALKRLHFGHQRWRDLIDVLEREAELAGDPGVRALAYYRVGRLWLTRLGSVEEALTAFERAARESSADPMILEELSRAYELARRFAEQVQVLEQLAGSVQSISDRLALFLRIGELYETRLGDEEQAILWYERARDVDRCYVPALQALSKLYTQREDFARLVAVHLGEAEGSQDGARRAAAHARIAEIYETRLSDAALALQHHGRALAVVPGYAASFKASVRLLSQARRYVELVELYERAVDQASDVEGKVTYLYKIGRLYEDAVGSPAQALVAYRRILEVAPQELSAIHSLQRAAELAGLHRELVEALELEAASAVGRRKLELLHRAGEVAEVELQDEALAVSLFKRLVELDKTYGPAYASLGRLFYRAGRWEELLETYKSELRLLGKGPTLSALQFKMGQLYEERLGRDDEALASFRRAVEADPSHRAAARSLERKLEQKNMWDELVRMLEAEARTLEDPKLRARASLRIGEVYENRLRSNEKGLDAYEQALSVDPELVPARDGRIRLLTEAHDYKKLVEELEREVATQRDTRLVLAALLRAGEVYRDDLGDPARAQQAFEAVLERDPAHVEALLALEPLYADRGAWEALATVYATESRVLSDPGARVGALRELARLQSSGKVESKDRGRIAYGSILQLLPADTGALFALERMALLEKNAELLAHVDAKLAAVLTDPVSIATHETRLGELMEAAGDPQAVEVFRAALARDAEAIGAARGMSRIAERVGDPELLGEAAEREARVSLDVTRAATGLVQAGARLWSTGSLERAVQAFSRALEVDPEHEVAAQRLREALLGRGDPERLVSLLTRAAGAAKKPARVAALWASIAELHAEQRKDLAAALAALQRAHTLLPGHAPTLMRMAALFEGDGQWQEAAERLKLALAVKPDAESAAEAHFRLANIYDEHLSDPSRALAHVESVLSHDANHRGALERLVVIRSRKGQLDQAADLAQRLVRVSPELKARVSALVLLGRVERKRGQLEAAAHAYEQAVAAVGTEGHAAREFRELVTFPRGGDGPTLSRYLAALLRFIESSPNAASAAYAEAARTLAEDLNQPENAISLIERGVGLHPGDAELRSQLADVLLRVGQNQRALAELERVVQIDVTRQTTWRQIAETLQRLQRVGDGSIGIAPLVALGFATEAENARLAARAPRVGGWQAGAIGENELTAISPLPSDDPAARLVATLGDIPAKIFPPELERWGVGSRDRLNARSGQPLRVLADRLAATFGLAEFDLYVHRAHSGLVELELTDPVSLLVPAHVLGLSEAEQTFLLARGLVQAARGLAALERLTPQNLAALLAAAARLVQPGFSSSGLDEELVSSLSRKFNRALPWIGRGPIEEAAQAYAQDPPKQFDAWLLNHEVTAARVAALLSDDLPACVRTIRRFEGDLSGAQGASLARSTELIYDLSRFWVSDAAYVLRRRVGLL